MEDEVLANAGVDVFEEVFKLIFTKLYDEHKSQEDRHMPPVQMDNIYGKIIKKSAPYVQPCSGGNNKEHQITVHGIFK